MSLLNVTVKRAKYIGNQATQLNTYVTLKLQNVKSTTVTVKGSEPCWEQDFVFETNNINSGLLVEVWTKGMIWDRALGYQLISLETIAYSTEDTQGEWYPLDMDVILMNGEVAGTKNPTGHMILLDCRFELPFDPDTQPGELQRKLEILNGTMTQDRRHRQAQYLGNSGYSEDSDYTSDFNYPVGQNANSSASQYRNLRTPQCSLETSRENSYEKDDRSYYDSYSGDSKYNLESFSPANCYYKDENDPLSYNSRPMSSVNSHKNNFYGQNATTIRKRSLERQDTLYDEYGDTNINENIYDNTDDHYGFYDMNSDNLSEDRQWDSGGRGTSMNKILPKIPIKHSNSMVEDIYNRGASLPVTPSVLHKKTRLLPQPIKSTIATSLSGIPRILPQPKLNENIISNLDKNKFLNKQISNITNEKYITTIETAVTTLTTTISELSHTFRPLIANNTIINYNEDYNYAYNSTDNLTQTFNEVVSRRKGATLPTIPSSGNLNIKSTKFNELSMYKENYNYDNLLNTDSNYDKKLISSNLNILDKNNSIIKRRTKILPTPDVITTKTGNNRLPSIPIVSTAEKSLHKMISDEKLDDSYYYETYPPTVTTSYTNIEDLDRNYSNKYDYDQNSYYNNYDNNKITTTTNSVSKVLTATTPTTTTTTTIKPILTSGGSQSTKTVSSGVFGSITTGLRATVNGVVGNTITSSSSSVATSLSSSITSTAKNYFGIASKFLPNLTGSLSGGTTVVTTSGINISTTTITKTSTTIDNSSNLVSDIIKNSSNINSINNDYYYLNDKNSFKLKSNNQISYCGPYLDTITTSTNITTLYDNTITNNSNNYNKINDINVNNDYYNEKYCNQTYYDDSKAVTAINDAYDKYNYDLDKKTSLLQTSEETDIESSIGNIVDYSDYKYGFDNYNYSEKDYIATGDITDKENFNNNYDIYEISTSTTSKLSVTTPITSSLIKTTTTSSYNYDFIDDYNNDENNKLYCDNSSNLVKELKLDDISKFESLNYKTGQHMIIDQNTCLINNANIKSTSYDTQINSVNLITSTMTNISEYNDNSYQYQNINDYYDNEQRTIQMTAENNKINETDMNSIASTTIIGGKKLPKIYNKLSKQLPTEINDSETDLTYNEIDDEINNEYYNKTNYQNIITSPSMILTESFDLISTTAATTSIITTGALTTTTKTATPIISEDYYQNKTSSYDISDSQYYDYREDYFNEEDEYKYLEKEQEQIDKYQLQQQQHQNIQQQLLSHQKQPPLEYIEESRDDYNDDLHLSDNEDSKLFLSGSYFHSQPQQQRKLSAQEIYADIDTNFVNEAQKQQQQQQQQQQQKSHTILQHQSLVKQDSIIEDEDEDRLLSDEEKYDQFNEKEICVKDEKQQKESAESIESDIKKRTLLRGETEEVTSGQLIRKPEVTGKQRWHWAYNKITMQLNVSTFTLYYYTLFLFCSNYVTNIVLNQDFK